LDPSEDSKQVRLEVSQGMVAARAKS
jgi:hypothetical protein